MYGSGVSGFCQGGKWMCSGVLWERYFLKCVWRTLTSWLSSAVISFMFESLVVARFGWSLAFGWRLVAVLRFWG